MHSYYGTGGTHNRQMTIRWDIRMPKHRRSADLYLACYMYRSNSGSKKHSCTNYYLGLRHSIYADCAANPGKKNVAVGLTIAVRYTRLTLGFIVRITAIQDWNISQTSHGVRHPAHAAGGASCRNAPTKKDTCTNSICHTVPWRVRAL